MMRPRLPRGPFALAVAAVVAIAFALRVYAIDDVPPGYVDDELAGAVSAWSIATTGHDIDRTWLPFLWIPRESMKQPVYGFATVLPQAILGQVPLAVRLPAVVFGTLAAGLVIWAARALGRQRHEAIVAGGLFAATPWAVHYGRIGWEPAALLPFTLCGLVLLWLGLERHRAIAIAAGIVILAAGAYSYAAALFLHATLGALALAVHARTIRRGDLATVAAASLAGLAILAPYLRAVLTEPFMTERLRTIWVFRDGYDAAALAHVWANTGLQWDLAKLFLEGDWNLHYGPGMQILLWPFAVLVPAGLVAIALRRDRVSAMLGGWVVVGQLPGILTDFPPNWSRGLAVVPALCILAGIGALALWRSVDPGRLRVAMFAVVVAATVVQGAALYRSYFVEYPERAHGFFRTGLGDLALETARQAAPADVVCVQDLYRDIWGFDYYVRFALGGPPPFQLRTRGPLDGCAFAMTYFEHAGALAGREIFVAGEASPYALVRLR